MKKGLFFIYLCGMISMANAQGIAVDSVDIANFNARIKACGNHFYDPAGKPGFVIPKGSGMNTLYCSTFWIGGADVSSQLYFAGERYRQPVGPIHNAGDFFPGPLTADGSASTDSATMAQYNRIWKLTKQQVDDHIAHWNNLTYIPPIDLLEWPAHGDTLLHQSYNLAPYFDYNGDGRYTPMSGDYPLIRGDQCLYFIFNDAGGLHQESGGPKMGIEVHAMAYAFNCPQDSAFKNTLFMNYTVINRSTLSYHDVYLGVFSDTDIGYSWSDFTGSDTLLNCFYVYESDTSDILLPDDYRRHPPAQATVFLNKPMSSFMYFSNLGGTYWAMSDPTSDSEYYSYLLARWLDGSHLLYGGMGHSLYGGTYSTDYMFPGEVNDTLSWTEITAGNTAGDRRGVGAIGPYNFSPGYTFVLDFAYVYGRDPVGDNLSSVGVLRENVLAVRECFQSDSTPCGGSFSSVRRGDMPELSPLVHLFPNPVTQILSVESGYAGFEKWECWSADGILVKQGRPVQRLFSINLSDLSPGMYVLRLSGKGKNTTTRFVKQ